jgi:hypothetical protein
VAAAGAPSGARASSQRGRVAALVEAGMAREPAWQAFHSWKAWTVRVGGADPAIREPDLRRSITTVRAPGRWSVDTDGGRFERRAIDGVAWEIDLGERIATRAETVADPHDLSSRVLYQCDGFGSPTIYATLAEEIRASEEVSYEERDGAVVYRYRLPDNHKAIVEGVAARGQDATDLHAWTFQVELDSAPPHRLRAMQYEFMPRSDPAMMLRGARIEVVAWATLPDGTVRPKIVERRTTHPKLGSDLERFELTSFELLVPEDAIKRLALPIARPGWRLMDRRRRLMVEVGTPFLELEGRRLRVDRVLNELPDDDLAELLKTAVPREASSSLSR